MLDELETGLTAELDGRVLALERIDRHAERRTDVEHESVSFELRFTAPVALTGEHELRVSTGNLPDTTSFFASSVEVAPELEVTASNLLVQNRHGRWVDDSGRYRLGDKHREVRAEIAVRSDLLARAYRWSSGAADSRGLLEGRARSHRERLLEGGLDPELFAGAVGLAIAAGAGAGPTLRRPRWVLAGLLVALLGVAIPTLAALVAPLVVLAACARPRWRQGGLAPLWLAACVATGTTGGWAIPGVLTAALVAGAWLTRHRPVAADGRWRIVVALVLVAAVIARAVATAGD